MDVEHLAGRRGLHAARPPPEQRAPAGPLERGDAPGHARLRVPARVGGPGERAAAGHLAEHPQVLEGTPWSESCEAETCRSVMSYISACRWWHVECGRRLSAMHLGLFLINGDVCATDPAAAARIAVAAEAAGLGERVDGRALRLPDPPVPASPARADLPLLDPFVALAHLAGRPARCGWAPGVTVVPLHHPLVLAKLAASLDRRERRAVPVRRGRRLPRARVPGPGRPARRARRPHGRVPRRHARRLGRRRRRLPGSPRLVLRRAGRAAPARPARPAAPRRRVRRRLVPPGRDRRARLVRLRARPRPDRGARRRAARGRWTRHERPAELGPLEISITPPPSVALDDATLDAYAELGVTRLIALSPREGRNDADAQVRFVEELGARRPTARRCSTPA